VSLTLRVLDMNGSLFQTNKAGKPNEAKSIHALLFNLYVLYLYMLLLVFSTKWQRTAGEYNSPRNDGERLFPPNGLLPCMTIEHNTSYNSAL